MPSLYLGQVATKIRIPTSRSTTNKQANSRTHHFARDHITALKIELPNWYWVRSTAGPETNGGGNITYKASIEYPAGVFTQVTFSGATSAIVASGASVLSDFVNVNIPKGASFWVRVYAVAATAIVFTDGNAGFPQRDDANGEAYAYAASGVSDLTMGGTITSNIVGGADPIFCPSAIVAQTRNPSVLIIGDSRDWGFNDLYDASGDLGDLARSIGPAFGYINVAGSGDKFSAFISVSAKRRALAQYCSHVVIGDAINALRSGGSGQNKTAAAVLAELQTVLGFFPDKRCFTTTLGGPNTTSTDNWATVENQTVNANSAQIIAYNDAIRAGVPGCIGYFEIADQVESARNSGKWRVNGNPNGFTLDGLHTGQAGYLAIKNSGAIDTTRFSRAGL
ncbi:hypothetical protein [Mesorhizobium sp.]|uniref:hypothetical protein n=1 Tax=Mesorhizobium sp. TaxID=1871066 RepID=UPI000FE4CA73|nr:hypothetical protein [Mesorhizobium sp.]RWI35452.1 MAG: SGNH/GDSL hydrolase family protein [Mesorhizobium sp.]RWJ66379.1 MAG: SGNH/GDSL hydrolase family protein [Mesorhizobium sp.]